MAAIRKPSNAGERLASMEATFAAHAAADALAFAELKVQVAHTHTLVEKLTDQVSRQRSFIGGIVFTVSAVWAVVLAFIAYWPSRV
jgi:hypothetical protein